MNPYETLGVEPDATVDEIGRAYRRLARKHHPDAGGDATKFAAIAAAWELLSDPDRRRAFDETGETGGNNAESVLFTMMGGLLDEALEADVPDLVKHMVLVAKQGRKNLKVDVASSKATMQKLEKKRSALTFRDGCNADAKSFFQSALENKIQTEQKRHSASSQAIDMLDTVIAMLDGIECVVPSGEFTDARLEAMHEMLRSFKQIPGNRREGR